MKPFLFYLVGLKYLGMKARRKGMQPQVRVGADGVDGGIFPGLHPFPIQQVVSLRKENRRFRFPTVKRPSFA